MAAGCSTGRLVWGVDKETFLHNLHQGDYAFLKNLTDQEKSPREILRLGESAPFYLSYVYRKIGMPSDATTMLETAVDRSQDPWRRWAGIELMEQYISDARYDDAEHLGEKLFRDYPTSMDIFILYTESLYWLEKDKQVVANLSSIARVGTSKVEDPALKKRIGNGELDLWMAASSARLGTDDWKALVRAFFLNRPATDQHNRLYIFLDYRKSMLSEFTPAEQDLFHAISEMSQSSNSAAVELFSTIIDDFTSKAPSLDTTASVFTPDVIENIARAYTAAGSASRGVQAMKQLAPKLQGIPHVVCLDVEGRMLLRSGQAPAAREVLTEALGSMASPPDSDKWYTPARRDRLIWYLLDADFTISPYQMPTELNRYLPATTSATYFSDLEESLLSDLVNRRAWSTINQVHDVLVSSDHVTAAAAYALVLAEAMDKGLMGSQTASLETRITSLLQEAAGQSNDLYNRFVAEAALRKRGISTDVGQLLQFIPSSDTPDSGSATDSSPPGDQTQGDVGHDPTSAAGTTVSTVENMPATGAAGTPVAADGAAQSGAVSPEEKIVDGFFEYGLVSEAADRIRDFSSLISLQSLLSDAKTFADDTRFTDSIRTLDIAAARPNFHFDRRLALMMYPQAFQNDMDKVIKQESLKKFLFYALVREESYFDSGIISRAGAVGLTQLMPDTATDVASRFSWKNPDLSDPAVNLRLGARYLRVLLDAFQQPILALAAYNGGQGRVRQWKQTKDLPSLLLFHESIPLPETRQYIRKILVSAVYYGYLYEDMTPSETIAAFFPDLM